MAIDNHLVSSVLIRNCVRTLEKASNILGTLELFWVKAHAGIPGNEIADDLAKLATRSEHQVQTPWPNHLVGDKIEKFFRDEWNEKWKKYSKARQTKQFYSGNCKKTAKTLLKLSRDKVTKFVNVTTGHNGVGGSNLGQTQVELSGLNRVFHELGPPRGVAEYIH